MAASSGTLTANTVANVTITGAYQGGLSLVNRSMTGTIWYTLDGTTPTVAGTGCHPLLGAVRIANPYRTSGADSVVVKLISTAALDYTVETAPVWVKA